MFSWWRSLCRACTSPYLAALVLFAIVMFFVMMAMALLKINAHGVLSSMQRAP